jgi:hypothetical protein
MTLRLVAFTLRFCEWLSKVAAEPKGRRTWEQEKSGSDQDVCGVIMRRKHNGEGRAEREEDAGGDNKAQ